MNSQLNDHIPRAVTDGEIVLASAHVAMPPSRVFQALNTDEVERWWGADDVYWQRQWKSDLRVGGKWSVVTRTADGKNLPAGGEFLEIDEPRKVVITRTYDFDFPELGWKTTVVTYRFDPIEGGTRVTVKHEGFGGLWGPAQQHAVGWERVLGWLQAYMRVAARNEE